jgi:hypothetical protein
MYELKKSDSFLIAQSVTRPLLDSEVVVTPQVFIFLSTTSTDLSTQYQWIKRILNFNHPRLLRI